MLISDWLHEDAAERYPGRLAVNTGQDPESMLINGRGQFRDPNTGFMTNTPLEIFTITPGRRYRFRLINAFASVCPAQVTIEGHGMTVIATDGEPVHPVNVNTIISFSGRSILLQMPDENSNDESHCRYFLLIKNHFRVNVLI